MPRVSARQEPAPDAYYEGHGLDSLVVCGTDAGAERRAYLRETHRRNLEREAAAERATREAAMAGTEAAVLVRQRSKERG